MKLSRKELLGTKELIARGVSIGKKLKERFCVLWKQYSKAIIVKGFALFMLLLCILIINFTADPDMQSAALYMIGLLIVTLTVPMDKIH